MKLELYIMQGCPYCRRVTNYIEESGRTDIEEKDIYADEANRQRLIDEGGKVQVPCLFVDGEPMYESLDIIDFMTAHPQSA